MLLQTNNFAMFDLMCHLLFQQLKESENPTPIFFLKEFLCHTLTKLPVWKHLSFVFFSWVRSYLENDLHGLHGLKDQNQNYLTF